MKSSRSHLPSRTIFFSSWVPALLSFLSIAAAFVVPIPQKLLIGQSTTTAAPPATTTTSLHAIGKLSRLPSDISPFEKGTAKGRDVQGEFRNIAQRSITQALKDGKMKMEVEFPPLVRSLINQTTRQR